MIKIFTIFLIFVIIFTFIVFGMGILSGFGMMNISNVDIFVPQVQVGIVQYLNSYIALNLNLSAIYPQAYESLNDLPLNSSYLLNGGLGLVYTNNFMLILGAGYTNLPLNDITISNYPVLDLSTLYNNNSFYLKFDMLFPFLWQTKQFMFPFYSLNFGGYL